jgi:protein TonB
VLNQEQKEFEKGAVRAVGDIKPPRRIKAVDPVYPEIARQAQVEGVVIVEARADEKGNVEDARILRSIPLLDQAAVEAVKQWKYEPAIINGKPQKVIVTVTVRFMLKSGDKEKDLERFAQGAVKAEGAIPPPKLIKSVDPVYPEIARQARVEGIVMLAAKTDATGKVQDVMILRSIPLLNQAAIDAVRQWVYEPLVINNVPKPVVFTVSVRFLLDTDYRIKPNDLLRITVQELPDLNQDVKVSDDGQANISVLGKMEVVGQTAKDLEKTLAALLQAKFLKAAPHVTVVVKEKKRGAGNSEGAVV